ncbi:MAG: hypothetical protein IMY76_09480 [Chloroflexi bacterium]|nr:hypothetical protein [Chloroflexota bacterium]
MNGVELNLADLSGAFLGFTFTIFTLSYLLGDNPFFRVAIHIFIGVSAAYAVAVTLSQVILPQLIYPFFEGDKSAMYLSLAFLIPSLLLLTKISTQFGKIGNASVAVLVGIGAAAAIGGASQGTIFTQMSAAINIFDSNNAFDAIIITLGTMTTLIYFQFSPLLTKGNTAQLTLILDKIRLVGKIFIAIAFAALFSGVYLAALSAFIERISFLWSIIREFFVPAFF